MNFFKFNSYKKIGILRFFLESLVLFIFILFSIFEFYVYLNNVKRTNKKFSVPVDHK